MFFLVNISGLKWNLPPPFFPRVSLYRFARVNFDPIVGMHCIEMKYK